MLHLPSASIKGKLEQSFTLIEQWKYIRREYLGVQTLAQEGFSGDKAAGLSG